MTFKEKILTKSNSYNHYKEENKKLLEETERLKQEILELKEKQKLNIREDFHEAYGGAANFCNDSYIHYFLRDDFEDKLKQATKNMDPQSKKDFKWYYLRAIASTMLRWDTLYFKPEVAAQKSYTEFKIKNSTPDGIAGYKFTGDYNLHPFIDLNLNKSDMEFIKDKDIIDAGAFTGDTSLPLSKITNRNVYAFEPFEDSFKILEKNIDDNNIYNIIPVNKSLGNINGERTLFLSGNNVQGITSDSSIRDYDNELKVQETTLDKFVEDNNLNVGYITVDVEGAELDLLKGAENTIRTQKPILSISIYHKVSDYFEIIPWIDNLDLGYEHKIVKEAPWSFIVDIVVQCRPKK